MLERLCMRSGIDKDTLISIRKELEEHEADKGRK